MNALELMDFSRVHRDAGEFLLAATDDYVACRCCLLNGLFPGLRLGAEAVEKYLKAFVLYGGGKITFTHRISELVTAANSVQSRFSGVGFEEVISRLERHYRQRYPNVPDFRRGASTAELNEIDKFVLYIYESLPIPEVPKFRLYGYFFRVCCPWAERANEKTWLEQKNIPLQRARKTLLERYQAMEVEIGEVRD
jgi:hypothetical protein